MTISSEKLLIRFEKQSDGISTGFCDLCRCVSFSENGEGSAPKSSATSAATSGVFRFRRGRTRLSCVYKRNKRRRSSAGESLSHLRRDVTSSRVSETKAAIFQYSDMDVCKQGGVKTTSNKRQKPKSIHQHKEDRNPGAKSDLVSLPGFSSGIGSPRPTTLIRLKPDRTASAAAIGGFVFRLGLRLRRRRRTLIAAVSSFICGPSAEADE